MSQTASTLLLRNLHDVFGEIDPVRRRAAIDEIFHEDAVFYEPNGAYRGRDEIRPHRFSRAFKRFVGISPGAARRREPRALHNAAVLPKR